MLKNQDLEEDLELPRGNGLSTWGFLHNSEPLHYSYLQIFPGLYLLYQPLSVQKHAIPK